MQPADIEATSFTIITEELAQRGIELPPGIAPVVKRVIHTTADFDYTENLVFTETALAAAAEALLRGQPIITDTNMAKAGVSKAALARLGCTVHCFMADADVAAAAQREGTTRAVAAVRKAAQLYPTAIFAVGNAPTALIELVSQMQQNPAFSPSLVIGVPVGFVNVVESKELLLQGTAPAIVARGRKGGSNVAAAICNALLYTAADMLDPGKRN